MKKGDVFLHPPNEPHQLSNPGADDLEVMIIADHPLLDACYYPDSNKWGLCPPGKFFRMTEVDYFDGEEAGPALAPRVAPSASPARVATPLYRQRNGRCFFSWRAAAR